MSDERIHFRYHRGGLDESMRTAVIVANWKELEAYVRTTYPVDIEIVATPYIAEDKRIGWRNVHLVSSEGFGVIGFCAPFYDDEAKE